MINLEIKSKTEAGDMALLIHYEETKPENLTPRAKIMMRIIGYKQEMIEGTHKTLLIYLTHRKALPENIEEYKNVIIKALKDNGAEEGKDYEIIVK